MTSIPPFPGVPALLANTWVGGVPVGQILSSDLVPASLFLSGAPQWGLYLDGAPAVVFETFVSLEYREEYAISDYPLEDGGFESFNKVQVPFNVRIRLSSGGTAAARTALLGSLRYISGDRKLYTVVSPDAVYDSVNVQRVDYHRESQSSNGLVVVDIFLLEIRTRVVGTTSSVTGSSIAGAGAGGDVGTTQFDLLVAPNTGSSLITNPKLASSSSIFNDGYVSPIDSSFQALSPQIRNDPARGFTVY